jgi:predicted ATPase
LVTSLRDKKMLLVLDNCEHVVGAVAGLVAAVLRDAPGVHVLVTSCEPLQTEGERLCRLAGLESPPADCVSAEQALRFPAVELFVERTAATVGELDFGDANAAAVCNICSTLDGNPLAIELAAKRVSSLGINGFAAGLGDPLGLLTNGHRTAARRQQSMRATLDWSHDLLTERQQIVLRRLAVFSGEFTLPDATSVIFDQAGARCPIDEVTGLVTKSLIVSDVTELPPRFRLPYTTRAYALEKLRESGESDAAEQRLGQQLVPVVPSTTPV